MKNILRLFFIAFVSVFVFGLISNAECASSDEQGSGISRRQLEAQVYFFQKALDEFGASSPDQAVSLWAKGDETRNGVLKYAAACGELKKQLTERWGKAEKNFWIIGGLKPLAHRI